MQKPAFLWSSEQGHNGHNAASGLSSGANKCNPGQTVSGGAAAGTGPGFAHWMSVMAEHMNNAASTPHHHDPVHYMWNGVDVSEIFLYFLVFYASSLGNN